MGCISFFDGKWEIATDKDQWILYQSYTTKKGERALRSVGYYQRFEQAAARLFDKECRDGEWESIQELREYVSQVRQEILDVTASLNLSIND